MQGEAAPAACALSPFVNLETPHDGRSARIWMKKLTTFVLLWEGKKDLLESTKMDVMRLIMNYSK